jgi:hypothetical protein
MLHVTNGTTRSCCGSSTISTTRTQPSAFSPSDRDRLSRLERALLNAAAAGPATRESLCVAVWKMEPWRRARYH